MNQQYPQQPGPGGAQQPGWGQQPQQPYPPQQPGWGAPPPPPKKTPVGMIVGLGCLGIVVLFVIIGAIGAVAGSDSSSTSKGTSVSTDDKNVETEKKDDTPAVEEKPAEEPAEEAAPESDVKIVAKKTAFTPSILASGSGYTSVKVTVTNNSDEQISINVLYFEITDSKGTKHDAELGVDENQIDTVDLAPGENVSGSITSKGKFTPTHVTYTQFLEDPVRVAVS